MTIMGVRCRVMWRSVAVMTAAALATMAPLAASPPRDANGEQERAKPFNLGVLRADGVLLPFASFDGEGWKASWPGDLFGRELPVSTASIPRDWWGGGEPQQWSVFPPDGGARQAFKTVAPTMFLVGAERRFGLRTDRAPEPVKVPPFAVAFPKVGLAIGGDADIKAISRVSLSSAAGRQLLQRVRAELNDAEERTVASLRGNTGWRHPLDRIARARVEAEPEAWYITALPGSDIRVSYVEAVKKYPPQAKDEGCGLETFISGWILHDEKQTKVKTQLKAAVMYCDRNTVSYMLPLGQIVANNRLYWIFQMSGPDHEWYAVAEATPTRLRVAAEYFAGGLQRIGGR
jgi:hypothetical protein